MGREASCRCRWGTEEADVRVHLETHEMILRGGMRRKVPLSSICDLVADTEGLTFRVDADCVKLNLGGEAAARWARAMLQPPSLASKLGILHGKRVKVLGTIEDEALKKALAQAGPARNSEPEIILILARTPEELDRFYMDCEVERNAGASIWIIYPKGKGKGLSESHIRTTLRARGMVDTKVASVSEALTALHFARRKAARN